MKFATILRETGLNPQEFPKISEIPTIYYDGKNRINSVDDVRFIHNLFVNNNNSLMEFKKFTENLENAESAPSSINIKIDEHFVVVFYKTPQVKLFPRKDGISPMTPLDYMD